MSAITATAIGLRIHAALIASPSITAACVVAFGAGSRQYVAFGPSPQQAPQVDECPLFIVTPPGKMSGDSVQDRSWKVRVFCAVAQGSPTVSSSGIIFDGWENLEMLLDLALAEVRTCINSKISIDSVETSLGDFDEFPVLGGSFVVTFSAPVLMGAVVEL